LFLVCSHIVPSLVGALANISAERRRACAGIATHEFVRRAATGRLNKEFAVAVDGLRIAQNSQPISAEREIACERPRSVADLE
jgi:predicted secreted Zn-dependent protease